VKCQCVPWPYTDHPQVHISYGDQCAYIDEGIADLTLLMWEFGLRTHFSCEACLGPPSLDVFPFWEAVLEYGPSFVYYVVDDDWAFVDFLDVFPDVELFYTYMVNPLVGPAAIIHFHSEDINIVADALSSAMAAA